MGVKIKLLNAKRLWLTSGLIACAGFLGYFFSDRFAEYIVDSYRPELENKLSSRLGHTLKIGEYKGLRPWGISIGPSKLLKGFNDNSSASISGLTVQFAPIATVLNRRPVAIFTPIEAKLNLRDNGSNPVWVLGESEKQSLPNIDLRVRLDDSSRIFVEPSNLEIGVTSNTSFNIPGQKVKGNLSLDLLDKGSINFKGDMLLNKLDFNGIARIQNVELETLNDIFLNQFDLKAKGIANGNFKLAFNNQKVDCKGSVKFKNLNLKRKNDENTFLSDNTTIKCSHNTMKIPLSEWQYGPWIGFISGGLPLDNSKLSTLDLKTLIRFKEDKESELTVDALLPLLITENGFKTGNISAQVNLKPFNLAQLEPFIGVPLAGNISANGTIKGPLDSFNSNFTVGIDNPKLGAARLQEKWRGSFVGSLGDGAELNISSVDSSAPGKLIARLNSKSVSYTHLTLPTICSV